MLADQLHPRVVTDLVARLSGVAPTDVGVLGAVPGERVVLAMRLGGRAVVAKAVADGSAPHLAASLAALALDPRPNATLVVPRLLYAAPERGLVVMSALEGVAVDGLDPWRELPAALCWAGVATAELHRRALPGLPAPTLVMEDHLDRIRGSADRLVQTLPQWGELVDRTFAALRGADRGDRPVTPIHGDLHLRQLVRCGSGIGIVDWDQLAFGDPAFDLAMMTTYLETHLGPSGAAAAEAFVDGYRAAGGPGADGAAGGPGADAAAGGPGADAAVARYRAFHLLRRACRRHRLRDRGWGLELRRMMLLLQDALPQAVPA